MLLHKRSVTAYTYAMHFYKPGQFAQSGWGKYLMEVFDER